MDTPNEPNITVPLDQYLVSCFVYWIEANGYKPHVLVNMRWPGVIAPPQCMAKTHETFNLHSAACGKVMWGDDRLEFNTRFGGRDTKVIIPYRAMITVSFAGTGGHQILPWTHVSGARNSPEEVVTEGTFVQQASLSEITAPKPEHTVTPEDSVVVEVAPDATPEGKSNVVAFDFARRSKK